MAQVSPTVTEACEAYLLSIEQERYYDAHEDLEALWFPRRFEKDDEVQLWKGFINAAVSFELMKRGRAEPSQKAWDNYRKYRPLLESIRNEYYPLYVKMAHYVEEQRGIVCPNF